MHYENPNLDKGFIVVSFIVILIIKVIYIIFLLKDVKIYSGAKWYGTKKYREIEFGIFTVRYSDFEQKFLIFLIN